jgi:PAS domain S-box-containing protein
VGACAAEKDIIMLTEIPQEYIEITSGLGGTNPNFLLLTPLINEDEVMGVIEIASLRRFEEHEILFVKEIAKSIATTLHSVKVNSPTAELLMKSKEQAEIMAAQEEEMRQNMEELQATQEEAARKTFDLEGLANALNTSSLIMEYDPAGVITSINEKYAELLATSRENTVGKHYSDMVTEINEKEKLDKLWKEIRSGKTKSRKVVLSIKGKELTLIETYTPILDPQGKLYKVLKIATDITNL